MGCKNQRFYFLPFFFFEGEGGKKATFHGEVTASLAHVRDAQSLKAVCEMRFANPPLLAWEEQSPASLCYRKELCCGTPYSHKQTITQIVPLQPTGLFM